MQRVLKILFLLFIVTGSFGQLNEIRRSQEKLANATNDTLRLYTLDELTLSFSEYNLDSSLIYAEQEIELANELNLKLNQAYAMISKAYALLNIGNYPRALQVFLAAQQLAEDEKYEKNVIIDPKWVLKGFDTTNLTPRTFRLQVLAWVNFNMGILYENVKNPEKEFFHYSRTLQLGEEIKSEMIVGMSNMNLGRYYLSQNKIDSALICEQKIYSMMADNGLLEYGGSLFLNLARVYLAKGEKDKAMSFFRQAIVLSRGKNYIRGVIAGNLALSNIKLKENSIDSAYYFANIALQDAIQLNLPDLLLRAYTSMNDYYNAVKNSDSIVKYQRLIIDIKDSTFNSTQSRQFQNIDFDEAQRRQELANAQQEYRNRLQKYMLLAGLGIFLFAVIILWRNNINKQKAFNQIKEQKQEIEFQKSKVEKTLDELKAAQAQLIQSEKMASLGELTAGIAHEIQNPLNFVNNFSDVNAELIDEANKEIDKGNLIEAKAILSDLKENQQKINNHGKRADAIVKGMLQHSRSSSGEKEMIDINVLCDEYLRLAYHGIRAKDKLFNAEIITDFDKGIEKLNVVPQDIGRVVLNLINNAFYAVSEKAKQNIAGFDPTVTISTKKLNDKIEISVKDNGNGIPDAIKEKIFQPFFTTKPTGQGTGLGLSLSYDIITKGHGGELKAESNEKKETTFIISIPTNG